jgi:hypothetical protein
MAVLTKACFCILSWAGRIQFTPLHSNSKIHFNIILLRIPVSSKRSLPFRVTNKFCAHFLYLMRATYPSQLILLIWSQ